MADYLMNTYARLPVTFTHGKGAWLYDHKGKAYLDALCGIAVTGLGHAHPRITEAIAAQAGRLIHTSNLYRIEAQEELAERLCIVAGMERAFFCNSGAEANEAAIKLARYVSHQSGRQNPAIAVMGGAFHGRTMATVTATGNRKVQAGFEPLLTGFVRVPFGNIDALQRLASQRSDIAAVLVEPIQGEAGVIPAPQGYLSELRALSDQAGWLMMVDEVQTGMGRTGDWFAYQQEGILPDVVTLAKGLGNGFPVGACLARGAAAEAFQPGSHGSTFGGGPLASRAALSVIETIEQDGLLGNAQRQGRRLKDQIQAGLSDRAGIVDLRQRGLMLGLELDRPCGALATMALEAGLLINVTAERVVRLLPPLILTDEETDEIARRLLDTVDRFIGAAGAQP